MPVTDRRAAVLVMAAIAAAAVAVTIAVVGPGNWYDDAFISFRYARQLAEGGGLVYNPGEWIEGYSNFLWTILCSVGLRLGIEPIHTAQALSVVAQVVTLWTLFYLGLRDSNRALRALVAPALLAGQVPFLSYPMTGLESSFFTMLVVVAFALGQRVDTTRRALALGIVLLALCLTRTDGAVLAFVIVAARVAVERRERPPLLRRLIPGLGLLVAGLAIYHIWRVTYYASWLPNTFHAKTTFSLERAQDGLQYVVQFFDGRISLLVLVLIGAVFGRTSMLRQACWIVAAHGAYVVAVGGDWMPAARFVLPVLPLLLLLAQGGLWRTCDSLRTRVAVPSWAVGLAVLALVAMHGASVFRRGAFEGSIGPEYRPAQARTIGLHLADNLPADKTLALEWGGTLPYYAPHPCLELFGLTDHAFAHSDMQRSRWGVRPEPEDVALRQPDVILPCLLLYPTAREAANNAHRVGEPAGRRYLSPAEMSRHGYRLRIVRHGEGAFFPVLVRGFEFGDPPPE